MARLHADQVGALGTEATSHETSCEHAMAWMRGKGLHLAPHGITLHTALSF